MAVEISDEPSLDPLGFHRYRLAQNLVLEVCPEEDQHISFMSEMEADYVRRWRHKGNTGYVSPLYHCSTENTTDLCFYDIADKLKTNSTYDIGGTYTEEQPDFWFYYTTSVCHGYNYLLNLFVVPRKPSNFSLFLPKSNKLTSQIKTNDTKLAIAYGPQTQLTFRTSHKDEHLYVKTFLFDADDIGTLENSMLLIPLTIQLHSKLQLDQNTVRTIKLRHNLSTLISQKESADFTLLSNTGKKYPVHKVLLAAHSPVLRSMVNNQENTLTLDMSDEATEIIIEFLYTGTLRNLYKQDFMMLLGIAERLQFTQLFSLAQQLLGEQINIQNAIKVAVIAKKYRLDRLTLKVFDFIKMYPEVLTTESWHCLEDIDLVKLLLKYLHPPTQNVE